MEVKNSGAFKLYKYGAPFCHFHEWSMIGIFVLFIFEFFLYFIDEMFKLYVFEEKRRIKIIKGEIKKFFILQKNLLNTSDSLVPFYPRISMYALSRSPNLNCSSLQIRNKM